MGTIGPYLPELIAPVDNLNLFQFQFDLFWGHGANQIIDLRVVSEQAAVRDLQDVVGLSACDGVNLAAQVQINAVFGHSLPERRFPAAFQHQAAGTFLPDRPQNGGMAHHDNILNAGIVSDDLLEPFELRSRDPGDNSSLGAVALLEHIDRDEQCVIVNEPEGRTLHAKGPVERHLEVSLKLAFKV